MILLHLSAGQAPMECCLAVGLSYKSIKKEAAESKLNISLLDAVSGGKRDCYKSLLLLIEGENADCFVKNWTGSMLWIQPSPIRPKHKRKNWYFSGQVNAIKKSSFDPEIKFQACRASGAGGQHVNTTDSAIRATHISSGISVRVESQRSQHANKRVAIALIHQKLSEQKEIDLANQSKERWEQHKTLERGNPSAIFKGLNFKRQ